MWYVDPFIFTIAKIEIINKIQDETGIYIIDGNGAYLEELNVFDTLPKAKQYALKILDKFFHKKSDEIINIKG